MIGTQQRWSYSPLTARASIGRDLCFNLGLVCIRTSTLMSSVISAADLPGDAPIGTGMVRAGAAAVCRQPSLIFHTTSHAAPGRVWSVVVVATASEPLDT